MTDTIGESVYEHGRSCPTHQATHHLQAKISKADGFANPPLDEFAAVSLPVNLAFGCGEVRLLIKGERSSPLAGWAPVA